MQIVFSIVVSCGMIEAASELKKGGSPMADLIVASLVAIALLAAVGKIIYDRKKKKGSSCAGDCTHCRGCR